MDTCGDPLTAIWRMRGRYTRRFMAAREQCGFSWVTSMPRAIESIAHFPERAVADLVTVSDAAVRARPSPEVWSAIEYAAHTGEAIGRIPSGSYGATKDAERPLSRRCADAGWR